MNRSVAYGVALLLIFTSTALNLAAPAHATTPLKSVASGKIIGTVGTFAFSDTIHFNSLDKSTGLIAFTAFSIGSGTQWSSAAFSSDTAGILLTVTATQPYHITYTASGAGTQRMTTYRGATLAKVFRMSVAATSWYRAP